MSEDAGTPPIGTIIELGNGVQVKVVANLAQILTGKDTCGGCYFYDSPDSGKSPNCSLLIYRNDRGETALPDYCGGCTAKTERQVIYVKEG